MRPLYEKQSDRDLEKDTLIKLAEHTGWKIVSLPRYYKLDACYISDQSKVQGYIEVKCRNATSDQYPTLFLSAKKWMSGCYYAEQSGTKFILAVRYTDQISVLIYNSLAPFRLSHHWGGRTAKTRDSADIEPVVHIPTNLFDLEIPILDGDDYEADRHIDSDAA